MSIGATSPFAPTGAVSLSPGKIYASNRFEGHNESSRVTNHAASVRLLEFSGDRSATAWADDVPRLPPARIMLSNESSITYAPAAPVSGPVCVPFRLGDGPTR
jgi:hypothetical protein